MTADYYDIQQKGNRDQQRHLEKIKESIREHVKELVANENIISSDGRKRVIVPVRYLDEYRFRFDPKNVDEEGFGQGKGNSKKGDVIFSRNREQGGAKPGEEHQEFQYLVEIDIDTLAGYLFEELSLPHIDVTKKSVIVDKDEEYTDRRKKGQLAGLDKKATLKEAIKRRGGQEDAVFIDSGDLRFRKWREKEKEVSSAVIFLVRDISGSMGREERFLTRAICFWIVLFLRRRYERADIVFINYDTEANEVDEDKFFHQGMGGGTKCTSALELTRDIIEKRYPPDMWNIYALQFSDGEDFDCEGAARFLSKIINFFNRFGYVEIEPEGSRYHVSSKLSQAYKDSLGEGTAYASVKLSSSKEVWEAIKTILSDEVREVKERS